MDLEGEFDQILILIVIIIMIIIILIIVMIIGYSMLPFVAFAALRQVPNVSGSGVKRNPRGSSARLRKARGRHCNGSTVARQQQGTTARQTILYSSST